MTKTPPKEDQAGGTKATTKKTTKKRKKTAEGAKPTAPRQPSKKTQARAALAAERAIRAEGQNRRWGTGVRAVVTAKASAHYLNDTRTN